MTHFHMPFDVKITLISSMDIVACKCVFFTILVIQVMNTLEWVVSLNCLKFASYMFRPLLVLYQGLSLNHKERLKIYNVVYIFATSPCD